MEPAPLARRPGDAANAERARLPRISRADLLALLVLLVVALAFCWPIFVPGWILPQGGGDLVSFLWPTYRYAARTLHGILSGDAPFTALLWNPTLYSGAPFAADNQTGLFYPPNLLLFLLLPDVPYAAMEGLVAFHLFVAGAGMYLLMRFEGPGLAGEGAGEWKVEYGLVPAFAFLASDVFITHLGNLNIVAVSAYLPLAFLGLRQALRAPGPGRRAGRWSLVAGLALGLAALAGHAQMLLILAVACAAYSLYELIRQRSVRVGVLAGTAAIVSFGASAIALLPALEMLPHTARAGLDYAEASRWSIPPLGLAGMITPLAFGRGGSDFWPPWDRVELGYMGLVTLVVAGFARRPRFFFLLALGGLVIAFGRYTPVHQALYQFVPGFSSIRVPARFILLTNFALAVLAGYGLARLSSRQAFARVGRYRIGPWLWLLILSALAVGLLLAAYASLDRPMDWRPLVIAPAIIGAAGVAVTRRRHGALAVLLLAELLAFGAFVEIDRADPEEGFRPGPAADYLLAQPGPTRIDLATSRWQPDAPAVLGLESITGISNPLALAAYDRYYWSVGYRGSPQYNFLNAQFVVADKDQPPADETFVPVFNEDPEVDVYLNTRAMPRVSLIDEPIFVQTAEQAFAAVHAPDFNPGSQVVLEGAADASWHASPGPGGERNLFYTGYVPGGFTVVARTPSPAYLVFSEVWYPGWAATVDGEPAALLRANTAFMAVQVPAGESTVKVRFTSPMLAAGAVLSAAALLACVVWLARTHRPAAGGRRGPP